MQSYPHDLTAIARSQVNMIAPSPPLLACGNCGHSLTQPDIEAPSSPFPNLLDGNHHAGKPKTGAIRAAIDAASTTISTLNDEICRLKSALDELQRKRDQSKSRKITYEGLLSPTAWVPSELLAEIFMHFRAEWGDQAEYSTKSSLLAITGVCRRWRDIALGTPSLWSAIQIVLHTSAEEDVVLESMVATWLMRAKSRPLSITIRQDSDWLYDDQHYHGQHYGAQRMFKLLIPSCARWRHFHLDLKFPVQALIAPIKSNLPNLQQLYLSRSNENALAIFVNAPQLSYLDYYASRPLDTQHALSLSQPYQMQQLRRLDCRIYLETGLELWVLFLTPNVETAHLSVVAGFGSTAQVLGGIHMPNLTHLCLVYHDFCDPSGLLEVLRTPALTSFEIKIGRCSGYDCGLALESFLSQSTALHRLKFHFDTALIDVDGRLGFSILSDVLKKTPQLIELHLSHCNGLTLDANFLDAFMVSDQNAPSSTAFLPTLTSISMIDNESLGKPPIDMIVFVDALRSRASQGLRQVLLSRKSPLEAQQPNRRNASSFRLEEPAVMEKLHQLRDQGLDIRVLVQGRDILS